MQVRDQVRAYRVAHEARIVQDFSRLLADALGIPIVGVPLANADNNQHGANENLRIRNLWEGIEIYAVLLTDLNWEGYKHQWGARHQVTEVRSAAMKRRRPLL